MFGWLRAKKPSFQVERELTFLTEQARVQAIVRFCREAPHPPVLLSPFRRHAEQLQEALRQRGLMVSFQAPGYRAAAQDPDALPLLLLGDLPRLSSPGPRLVLQIERHPLRAHDDAVLQALAALPAGTRLRILHSLDDGLLKLFSPNIRGVVERLGMAPDDELEHPMIASSIARAQERLATQVRTEIPGESFLDWRQKNLPFGV
jgi:hypothetical protein